MQARMHARMLVRESEYAQKFNPYGVRSHGTNAVSSCTLSACTSRQDAHRHTHSNALRGQRTSTLRGNPPKSCHCPSPLSHAQRHADTENQTDTGIDTDTDTGTDQGRNTGVHAHKYSEKSNIKHVDIIQAIIFVIVANVLQSNSLSYDPDY